MASILVVCYDTSQGRYLVQKIGSAQLSDNAVTSGILGSGIIGPIHFAPFASGQVIIGQGPGVPPIYGTPVATVADESITSAKLASGAVVGDRIAFGAVLSGHIGANVIAAPHIQNQGLQSANYGVGSIGGTHIADFGLVSGKYASGSITEQALASGISIDIAETLQEPTYRAATLISAYLAVQFSASGYFSHSQAGAINTMPAIGITTANIASGQLGAIQTKGRITNPDWDFSGHIGELVWVGTSSEVTLMVSSLMVSGVCQQRLGKVAGGSTIFLSPDMTFIQLAE